MNHLHLGKHHHRIHALTLTLTMVFVLLAASTGWAPKSYADYSHSPIGVINYCKLSGSTTVIRGWAHDPDAVLGSYPKVKIKVGTTTITVNTSILGYQDTAINKYLTSVRPTVPHSIRYGFTASFTGLYKGSTYAVSGTGLNYGSGINASLHIDSVSKSYDNIKIATLLNAPNILPDACLATKPAVPLPVPAPAPDPAPDTSSNDSSNDLAGDSSNEVPDDTSSEPVDTADVVGKANATVAVGTSSVNMSLPADGAQSIYILYGISADNLDTNSESVTVAGDKATVTLTGLRAKTTYYYQIVRTAAAEQITTSPTVDFKTAGYSIVLHLVNGQKKPVANIPGVLSDKDKTAAKSDKNGDLTFANLDPGVYTVKYQYNNHTYSKDFDTDTTSDEMNNSGKVAVLSDTVNVSTLKTASTTKKQSSGKSTVVLLFFIAVIGGVITWLLIRRRSMHRNAQHGGYTTTMSPAGPGAVDIPTNMLPPPPAVPRTPRTPRKQAPDVPQVQLDHVGESLREMVVRSMHEEAQKRKQGPPGPAA